MGALRILGVAAAVVSCAASAARSATAYRDAVRESYMGRVDGRHRWFVDVRVNSDTSRNTALRYLHQRASEICPSGYDVIDQASGESVSYGTVVGKGWSVTNRHEAPEAAALVECHAPTVIPDGRAPGSVEDH